MTPAAALAQDSNEAETFIGVSAGYHDLGVGSDEADGVELDDGELDGVDTSEGDLIVGAGVDIPLAGGKLRFNVDTVSFDTIRGTTGFVFSL